MKKMILATRGKVFTAKTLDRPVKCTGVIRTSNRPLWDLMRKVLTGYAISFFGI